MQNDIFLPRGTPFKILEPQFLSSKKTLNRPPPTPAHFFHQRFNRRRKNEELALCTFSTEYFFVFQLSTGVQIFWLFDLDGAWWECFYFYKNDGNLNLEFMIFLCNLYNVYSSLLEVTLWHYLCILVHIRCTISFSQAKYGTPRDILQASRVSSAPTSQGGEYAQIPLRRYTFYATFSVVVV